MECPTPCVCGDIVELDDMWPIKGTLPDGGNLVCGECVCKNCEGVGCVECGDEGYLCLTTKTSANCIELECDDLDFASIQEAMAYRQSWRIMPDSGSNVAGSVIAEICRGWMELVKHAGT